jgi:hypothetical protein
MKKLFFILFILWNSLVVSEAEEFNYYWRNNITGEYILDTLALQKYLNPQFRYKSNENKQNMTVTGFYYNSDNVKFIDEIQNGRIIKSTYFNKADNTELYVKHFYYDDLMRPVHITIELKGDGPEVKNQYTYFVSLFFTYNSKNTIAYKGVRCQKSKTYEEYILSSGNFDVHYNPVTIRSTIMRIQGMNSAFFETTENFMQKGDEVIYECYSNDLLSAKQRTDKNYMLTQIYDSGGNIIEKTEKKLNDTLETYSIFSAGTIFDNQISEILFSANALKIAQIIENNVPNGIITVQSLDENFRIKAGKIFSGELVLPVDIFSHVPLYLNQIKYRF